MSRESWVVKREMENTQIIMEEKLGFCKVLKKSFTIALKNPHFIIFAFLTSLPWFYVMLTYEIIFQHTLIETAKILLEARPRSLQRFYRFHEIPLGAVERLLDKVSTDYLLLAIFYLGFVNFLDSISLIPIVDSASMIYAGKKTMNLKEMLQRLLNETRFKGPLITSIAALLLASLILFGLASFVAHMFIASSYVFFMVLFGVLFIALLAKYTEWSAIWNMGIVISVLEEKQGEVALLVSSYLSRGNKQRGVLFVLVFFMWKFALRLSCLYVGWHVGGSGILVTAAHMSLICLGNIMKWVVFVVHFYDCKKQSREKNIVVEDNDAVA